VKKNILWIVCGALLLLFSRANAQFTSWSVDNDYKWDFLAGVAVPLQNGYSTGWGSELTYMRRITGGLYGAGTGDFYKIGLSGAQYAPGSGYWSIGGLLGLEYFFISKGIQPYIFARVGATTLIDQTGTSEQLFGFNGYEVDPLVNGGVGIAFGDRVAFAIQAKVVDVFSSTGSLVFLPLEIGADF
jgi:hypothetical protein